MKRLFLLALLLSTTAWADDDKKSKRTVVNFDGDTIDGDLMRPEGDLLAVRPELSLPSLVRAPSNFDRTAQRSLEAAADAVRSGP